MAEHSSACRNCGRSLSYMGGWFHDDDGEVFCFIPSNSLKVAVPDTQGESE